MDVLGQYARAEAAKLALEAELEALASELTSGNNPGLQGPLVDSEGFPRADIDIHRVRQLRHELVTKRTDLREVMREIEALLPRVFEVKSGQKQAKSLDEDRTKRLNEDKMETAMEKLETEWKRKLTHVTNEETHLQPFAMVHNVQKESPSDVAGLQPLDQVLRFGSADATNHRELAAVRDIVSSNIGSGIRVLVRRGEEVLALQLTPMRWSGDGVLGCLLQPL